MAQNLHIIFPEALQVCLTRNSLKNLGILRFNMIDFQQTYGYQQRNKGHRTEKTLGAIQSHILGKVQLLVIHNLSLEILVEG